jgi:hypothetical protein
MRLLDTDHPFFRPLWIRVATFAVTAGWAGLELWSGQILWACIVGALAMVSFHGFFMDFDPDRHPLGRKDDDPP